jgi:hypothetical protein
MMKQVVHMTGAMKVWPWSLYFGVLWGVPHQGKNQLDGEGEENSKKWYVHQILLYLNNCYLWLCVHLY